MGEGEMRGRVRVRLSVEVRARARVWVAARRGKGKHGGGDDDLAHRPREAGDLIVPVEGEGERRGLRGYKVERRCEWRVRMDCEAESGD